MSQTSNSLVVVAPDKFKGVLSATHVAAAIRRGVARARPDARIVEIPMADGGEGTLDVLLGARGGNRRHVESEGPLGESVTAVVGLVDQASTAIVEMATVAGLELVPRDRRNPLLTSTFGLGRVLRAVIEADIEHVILAVGGSATVDGGVGMMQALGMTFLDEHGRTIRPRAAGGDLNKTSRCMWDNPPANLEHVQITIACDVVNPATGEHGAAQVFAAQKGADAEGVAQLERGLMQWCRVLEQASGRRVDDEPGMGAAGGVALPLVALLGASIVPGVDLVAEATGLAGHIVGAELVITGEGKLDRQSMMGKVVGAVASLSRQSGVSCVAIVGVVGEGVERCETLLDRVITLDAPMDQTERRLEEVAERTANQLL